MKRLVIYFHYDTQGLLDEPCRFALRSLIPFGEIFLVTNGTLRQQDHAWAQQSGCTIFERENKGFDVGAYRDALLALGRERIGTYDELVLMNYTLAGPVCSLQTMFQTMDRQDNLDFWGLTRHYSMRSKRFGGNVPEHLQSHFLAVRQRLLKDPSFWTYWQDMQLPASYEESVIRHETRFTAFFQERGFAWDSYVQTQDLKPVFVNPIMACPRELLEKRKCPFFKRRSFFTPYADELRRTDGNAARDLYDYLITETEYPVSLLIEALLRSQPLSALSKNLHWHYLVKDTAKGSVDLDKEGLELIHFSRPNTDPVTDWYLCERANWADNALEQAVALFREQPLLGTLCPALPPWPKAVQSVEKQWQALRPWIGEHVRVPLDECPPPAPAAGWLLIRKEAFPLGIPVMLEMRQAWLAILQAQQNGYYSAEFESFGQASARMEQFQVYVRDAQNPTAVAKQLGRLIKHKLKR